MTGEFLGYDNNKGVIRGENGKRYFFEKKETEYSQGEKFDFEIEDNQAVSIFKLEKTNDILDTVNTLKDKVKKIDTSTISSNLKNTKKATEDLIKDIDVDSLKEIDYKSSFLSRFQNVFLVLMIFSFFTPLISFGFISASGITATGEKVWPILLLIVPTILLFLNITKSYKLSRPITIGYSALIILTVLYYEIFESTKMLSISSLIGFGGWMIILSSIILLLIEFKVIKENLLVKSLNNDNNKSSK